MNFIWFMNEKYSLFSYIPKNAQHDHIHAPVGTRKKDILGSWYLTVNLLQSFSQSNVTSLLHHRLQWIANSFSTVDLETCVMRDATDCIMQWVDLLLLLKVHFFTA